MDNTQHRSVNIVLGTNLEVLHVTVGVSDGDADGFTGIRVRVFLDLGHEHTLANGGLQRLYIGLQCRDTGFQGTDALLQAGVVILLGAANQEQRHSNTCQ